MKKLKKMTKIQKIIIILFLITNIFISITGLVLGVLVNPDIKIPAGVRSELVELISDYQ